jgi:neutral ceramidase
MLYAGVARTDITPPLGIAHAGWGAQTHQRATGVDLPLWATALALSDGVRTVVIVDLDLIYIWDNEAPAVMQAVADLTGLPQSHIRVSYTHTHSGPINGANWSTWIKEGSEMVPAYDAMIQYQVAGVAHAAIQRMRPARIAVGAGQSRIAVNRRFQRPEDGAVVVGRNWAGPVDPEVKVVRIDDADGQPLAALVNYACHPITVGPDCTLITPDYPGVVKRVVEQSTGATCMFLQGAAGNVGPVRGVARNGQHEYRRLGAILGSEASRVWWELQTRPSHERYVGTLESGAPLAIYAAEPHPDADTTLRVATRPLHLPLKQLPPPEQIEAEFADYNERLNHLRATGGAEAELLELTMLAKRAGMRADLARRSAGQTHRTFDLQVITIGDSIALVAMPGEPFVEIGMAIKHGSPFPNTLFSGYSNVGWAYIPMPDAYPLGGYEVEITPFSPDAAGQIVDQSLALLRELGKSAEAAEHGP